MKPKEGSCLNTVTTLHHPRGNLSTSPGSPLAKDTEDLGFYCNPRITSGSACLEWELRPVATNRDCGTEGDKKQNRKKGRLIPFERGDNEV